MGAIIEPIAETWLCIDCMIAHENTGDWPESAERITDITPNWGASEENDNDEEDGKHVFSCVPCGACETTLAGDRYRYAVWA